MRVPSGASLSFLVHPKPQYRIHLSLALQSAAQQMTYKALWQLNPHSAKMNPHYL